MFDYNSQRSAPNMYIYLVILSYMCECLSTKALMQRTEDTFWKLVLHQTQVTRLSGKCLLPAEMSYWPPRKQNWNDYFLFFLMKTSCPELRILAAVTINKHVMHLSGSSQVSTWWRWIPLVAYPTPTLKLLTHLCERRIFKNVEKIWTQCNPK